MRTLCRRALGAALWLIQHLSTHSGRSQHTGACDDAAVAAAVSLKAHMQGSAMDSREQPRQLQMHSLGRCCSHCIRLCCVLHGIVVQQSQGRMWGRILGSLQVFLLFLWCLSSQAATIAAAHWL
ncbi:hypothetical protein COO60DRAFT_1597456 [Scenedesmus sp. NREL 46B-D3]|nr:hypothetical protein COO60DRAFT_1597456 [Scenedesmus sp. NREL 46B-D3]